VIPFQFRETKNPFLAKEEVFSLFLISQDLYVAAGIGTFGLHRVAGFHWARPSTALDKQDIIFSFQNLW
jgi:hypothetical protein